jgi:CO dehydrogenase/acetyl-CoA synthase epsilon subunit
MMHHFILDRVIHQTKHLKKVRAIAIAKLQNGEA